MLSNLVLSIVLGLFVIAHSPAHAACRCCDDWAPGMLSFETGIGAGVCGQMRNFRCEGGDPDFLQHACADSGDCDLGPCLMTPPFCEQDFTVTCAQDSDCVGACAEQTTGGFPIDLECGRLYTGGGLNRVPLPLMLPDNQQYSLRVEACRPWWEPMKLSATTRASVGEHHCTEGRKCSAGSDNPGDPCVVHGECPNGACEDRCLFGPPLPIPNAYTSPTSVCIIRAVAEDASGTAQCQGGAVNLDMPLRWIIHVTGDLLNASSPPDVPGLQSCPLCTKVCVGGDNAGFPCVDDSECSSNDCTESEQCVAGPNNGLPCTPLTSRLDVHKCCANGGDDLKRCDSDADCAPPPGPAPRCELSFDPCAEDSDCDELPYDHCIRCVPGCTSYPTSHDCPPDPAMDITFKTGGLPIDFSLTTGTITESATDLSTYGRRVFCGYCRDRTGAASWCFEGDLRPGCPAAIPPADGNAVACTSNADCQANRCLDGPNNGDICNDNSDCPASTCVAGTDEYETCSQRNPGAFGKIDATQITVDGSTNGGCLADDPSYEAHLVSFYCIPPTFDPTIDSAGDLPGPGVEMMRVGMSLLPTVCGDGLLGIDEICDDGNTTPGDGCNATCQEVEPCFTCVGEPSTCTRSIATCTDGDGCCPAGCGSTSDDDCPRALSCKQTKAKAAGKKAADLLKAFGKNEKTPNVPKLAQDISKAQSKFTRRYRGEESKGGCQTIDDVDALEAKVDAFVSDVIDEICLP